MLQFFVMRIKISAVYFNFSFTTTKQYCLPISSSIGLTAVPPTKKSRLDVYFFWFPEYFGGIRKKRRDGIAIVRNKAQSRQRATRLYSQSPAKVPFCGVLYFFVYLE